MNKHKHKTKLPTPPNHTVFVFPSVPKDPVFPSVPNVPVFPSVPKDPILKPTNTSVSELYPSVPDVPVLPYAPTHTIHTTKTHKINVLLREAEKTIQEKKEKIKEEEKKKKSSFSKFFTRIFRGKKTIKGGKKGKRITKKKNI